MYGFGTEGRRKHTANELLKASISGVLATKVYSSPQSPAFSFSSNSLFYPVNVGLFGEGDGLRGLGDQRLERW